MSIGKIAQQDGARDYQQNEKDKVIQNAIAHSFAKCIFCDRDYSIQDWQMASLKT